MAMKSAEDNLAKAIFQLEVKRCKTSDLFEEAKTEVKVRQLNLSYHSYFQCVNIISYYLFAFLV